MLDNAKEIPNVCLNLKSLHLPTSCKMFNRLALVLILAFLRSALLADPQCNLPEEWIEEIRGKASIAESIIDGAVTDYAGKVYDSLGYFVDTFGPRLTGSDALENSIDYILGELENAGLENVHAENATIPYWIRGNESAELLEPRHQTMQMLGLGGSIGTPTDGITADVIVVRDFEELDSMAAEAEGKIVLFDYEYENYGQAVTYRYNGASRAAEVGAVAALVRSVTDFSIASPHAGALQYSENVTQIPAAAITVEDAAMLHRMYKRGQAVVVRLKMEAQNLPPFVSRNTVADLQGSTNPEQVVVVSGHLDSWDVGTGADDDAGGSFVSWHSLALLKSLGLRPKRTIRAILWTGDEQVIKGALEYIKDHEQEVDDFVFALQSDTGTFTPLGLGFFGTEEAACVVQEVLDLLASINATRLDWYSGDSPGTDVEVFSDRGVPTATLHTKDDRYFWFHHTNADTLSLETSRDLDLNLAVNAVVAYVVSDLSFTIPKEPKP